MDLRIIPSLPEDAKKLTEIAFAAKHTWNYPDGFFQIWAKELTISPGYIINNTVYSGIVQPGNILSGFYSIIENTMDLYIGDVFVEKGTWLEHIFISPEYQKKGIGNQLLNHALETTKEKGRSKLYVFVNPFARGFYEKTGAEFYRNSKSSIPGREIPVYVYNL